ncbi:MAG TPA: hypothetical protein VG146_16730 [Verrucomicrobiae bacterium]|nr:hypothetical protein [Verrucomicrobiae bacterium]
MDTINVLLANADRRTNNLIEAMILDVCFNQAVVHFVRALRIDEFATAGSRAAFDLILVSPDNLLPEATRRNGSVGIEEVTSAVREIKRRHKNPIVAFSVPTDAEYYMTEAGAEVVLGRPFAMDSLRAEVRRLLRMPAHVHEVVEVPAPNRWAFAQRLFSGLQRSKSAQPLSPASRSMPGLAGNQVEELLSE